MKKTIIITGAAGNLGRTVTSSLLGEGYFIHAAIGPDDPLDFIEHKSLKSNRVNLTDAETSEEYIHFITDYEEREIVALICLVGAFTMGDMETTDLGSIHKMIDLNFVSAFNVAKPLIQYCKKNNKPLQLILIGSRPAIHPIDGKDAIAYGLSKSLIFKLAEYINIDTNTTNINASVIVPSTMDTPGTRAAMPDAETSAWVPTIKVASTISFILSDTGNMMRNPIYKLYNKS